MESGSTLAWLMMSVCKLLWIILLDETVVFNDLLPLSFRTVISPIAMESAVTSCERNTPPWPTDIRLGHRIWFCQHDVWPMPHPSRSFKSHGLSCSFSLDVKMTFHACWVASVVSDSTPLSMEFSRDEYWSGLSCPLQGIFPTQGTDLCLFCLLN